ncbi:MAG: hypothetical protein GX761_03030, partial [Gammaproteobacteria bacterium]|nr:hypothetical protein [Gammaproteobacteria bacterium]
MRETSTETLVLPVGNGTTLRINYAAHPGRLDAGLYRGQWPKGTRLVFAIGEVSDSTRVDTDWFGEHGLWVGGTWFRVSATAAKRISAWLAAHGIGEPGAAPEAG